MERRSKNRLWGSIKIRVRAILWESQMYFVRLIISLSAITFGIFSYNLWGLLFILQGCIMLWSLLCNRRPKSTLWVDAVLGCALWTYTALTQHTHGLEIWIAASSWWLLIRYYSDEEK